MSTTKTYAGGCHCGKVRFEVTTDLSKVMSCNCSICSKKGSVLTFVTPEHFKLLSGEDNLTDYQFNTNNIHHYFCSTCGLPSWGKGHAPGGQEMRSINVRCLEDVDITKLTIVEFDGKKL